LSPSASGRGSGAPAIVRARRDRGAGDGVPAWIACRTLKRVLRRVDARALAKSTSSTGMLATRRCHGLAAIVGEPSIVSALGAARRGASATPTAKPMTTAMSPSTADSSANTAVTWRGVRPTALSSPISRCCWLARAPTRIATTENTTKSSTIV
jgi:hypothetical protein